jgi:hypothetical protein
MFVLVILLMLVAVPRSGIAELSANTSLFATGFNNPRVLKFGPDGDLYVTEAGLGGSKGPVACEPDPPSPFDPY